MINSYVKWNGQLSKLVFEIGGFAVIKVLKTNQYINVMLINL